MSWPLSQDYNEALQDPAQSFVDPELKQGEAVCNALGLPKPCSGNFADVYAVQSGSRRWAVKCFTRQIPGLQERYTQISRYLQQVNLPFMVEFKFLEQGVRVRSDWYPILKMQWVEGFQLNTFVKDNLDKPQVLQMLGQIWLRLASRLREATLAHCDLQHGNVLLVPGNKAGALSVKLVDYDGMCVPALERLKSIEVGHAAYQHPQRLKEGSYGLHIDRFPHLVICTALKALSVGGKALWDKFDNGDNLLFKQPDFESPDRSPVFQELLRSNDPEVRRLTQVLAQAAQQPIEQVPLVEEVVECKAAPTLTVPGVGKTAPVAAPPVADYALIAVPRPRASARKSSMGVMIAAGVGAVALIGGVVAFATMRGSHTSRSVAVAAEKTQPMRSVAGPAVRESTGSKPQTRPEPKIEPKAEPKIEPKAEPKIELPPAPPDPRLPVPSAETQSQAQTRMKTQLRADFTRIELVKEKRGPQLSLAARLLDLAAATDDAVQRFVYLSTARDLSAQVGSGASALKAVNWIGKDYAINLSQMKAEVLETVGKKTIQIPASKVLVTEALQVLDEVLQDEDTEAASCIFKVALAAAKNTSIAPVVASVEQWRSKVESQEKEAGLARAAAVTLETAPDDADANRILGKHLCFTRGEWDRGLPMLAKGSDEQLKTLASQDLSLPRSVAEQVELGDAWWSLGEPQTGRSQRNLQRRAGCWYQLAWPQLQGKARKRVARRFHPPPPTPLPVDAARFHYTEHAWDGSSRTVELIRNSQGFAFLSTIGGKFQGAGEWVRIRPNTATSWRLEGETHQPGTHAVAIAVDTPLRDLFQPAIKEFEWTKGMAPIKMLPVTEGICFLSSVGGGFRGAGEQVGVFVKDGYWYLDGRSLTPVSAKAIALVARPGSVLRTKVQEYAWSPGDKPMRMISQKDGFCFLSSVEGGLHGGAEEVRVHIEKDGNWYLSGLSNQPSLKAKAISVSFPQGSE